MVRSLQVTTSGRLPGLGPRNATARSQQIFSGLDILEDPQAPSHDALHPTEAIRIDDQQSDRRFC
jgi:hypothetical protein